MIATGTVSADIIAIACAVEVGVDFFMGGKDKLHYHQVLICIIEFDSVISKNSSLCSINLVNSRGLRAHWSLFSQSVCHPFRAHCR